MNCPREAALTAPRPFQYYRSKMVVVFDSVPEMNWNGPMEGSCLVEEMKVLTSILVSSWAAVGTFRPCFFFCKIR